MKKTAVQLLKEKIENETFADHINGVVYFSKEDILVYIEQALEIEKQQIMQSYSDGLGNGIAVGREESSFESVCDEEIYYKETYED